jgi:hypothetical protein
MHAAATHPAIVCHPGPQEVPPTTKLFEVSLVVLPLVSVHIVSRPPWFCRLLIASRSFSQLLPGTLQYILCYQNRISGRCHLSYRKEATSVGNNNMYIKLVRRVVQHPVQYLDLIDLRPPDRKTTTLYASIFVLEDTRGQFIAEGSLLVDQDLHLPTEYEEAALTCRRRRKRCRKFPLLAALKDEKPRNAGRLIRLKTTSKSVG